MAPSLLRVALIVTLLAALGAPGRAQYLFTDTNQDGSCDLTDYMGVGTDTVWVWLDTSHGQQGELIACPTGEELTISDYELCLEVTSYATGYHAINVGRWINKIPEFGQEVAFEVEASGYVNVHVYYTSPGAATHLPPGKRLLGGLEVTWIDPACNTVYARTGATFGGVARETSFYSRCPGLQGDNRIRLGVDFLDSCAAGPICSAVRSTTWGWMKDQYR